MTKLRSLTEFDDAVSDETAWRKQELSMARKSVSASSGVALQSSLRAGVLLLYAHWEGWIKNTSRLYLRFVNTKKLRYDELSVAFLGNALKTRLSGMEVAHSATTHNEFASFLREGMGDRARVSEDLVRTESNLSSRVLADIVHRLGLPLEVEFSTRFNMIDTELVDRRNTIAHGQYLDIATGDFLQLHSDVIAMLERFTDELLNAAATGAYRSVRTE